MDQVQEAIKALQHWQSLKPCCDACDKVIQVVSDWRAFQEARAQPASVESGGVRWTPANYSELIRVVNALDEAKPIDFKALCTEKWQAVCAELARVNPNSDKPDYSVWAESEIADELDRCQRLLSSQTGSGQISAPSSPRSSSRPASPAPSLEKGRSSGWTMRAIGADRDTKVMNLNRWVEAKTWNGRLAELVGSLDSFSAALDELKRSGLHAEVEDKNDLARLAQTVHGVASTSKAEAARYFTATSNKLDNLFAIDTSSDESFAQGDLAIVSRALEQISITLAVPTPTKPGIRASGSPSGAGEPKTKPTASGWSGGGIFLSVSLALSMGIIVYTHAGDMSKRVSRWLREFH